MDRSIDRSTDRCACACTDSMNPPTPKTPILQEYMKILTFMTGRGFFYIFVGTIELGFWFSTLHLVIGIILVRPGGAWPASITDPTHGASTDQSHSRIQSQTQHKTTKNGAQCALGGLTIMVGWMLGAKFRSIRRELGKEDQVGAWVFTF